MVEIQLVIPSALAFKSLVYEAPLILPIQKRDVCQSLCTQSGSSKGTKANSKRVPSSVKNNLLWNKQPENTFLIRQLINASDHVVLVVESAFTPIHETLFSIIHTLKHTEGPGKNHSFSDQLFSLALNHV